MTTTAVKKSNVSFAADRLSEYAAFLSNKLPVIVKGGIEPRLIPKFMRDDQKYCTRHSLLAGRYAIFGDCGVGKTFCELEYERQLAEHGRILHLAPLCVGIQTAQMAKDFGYEVNLCKTQADVRDGINITNYERMDKFDADKFAGIILDESSILKNFDGKTRNALMTAFRNTRFKLCCTATPAPNDYIELGNHAEFLGVMTAQEMLAMYFVHDGGETQKWRLKRHAEKAFWKWVATWSTTYSKPSDIDPSFSDEGFNLPKLNIHQHVLHMAGSEVGKLFDMPDESMNESRKIKRKSIQRRAEKVVEIAQGDEPVVVWCDLNDEADLIESELKDSRQLCGAMPIEEKEEILWAFTKGELKRLVTKQKITSHGLNWQHCNKTINAGPNYSCEAAYQEIKRFHRYGQKRDVDAHWVMMDLEYPVFQTLMKKMQAHGHFKEAICKALMSNDSRPKAISGSLGLATV